MNLGWNYKFKSLLYSLKRQYGAPLDIHVLVDASTDATTGERTQTTNVYHVKLAIPLPNSRSRKATHSISQISQNKKFVQGGYYEQGVRDFLVDRNDIPSLEDITTNDWVVFKGKKYQIKVAEYNEYDCGWIIKTQELVGEEVPRSEFNTGAANTVTLADEADGSQP